MANLAEAVDATERDWLVSADVPHGTEYLTVESEVVQVLAHFPSSIDPQTLAAVPPRIRVARAAGGTTAASHADTTALTPLIPPSAGVGGAGGLTVDNTVDPPAEVTTIIAPAAIISGDEATIPVQNIINLEATGENDAGFDYSASVEDGDASFEAEVFSENSLGQAQLTAAGGAKLARIRVEASDAVGSFVSLTGETVVIENLPTADPVLAGALWIDVAGGRVLKVSAG